MRRILVLTFIMAGVIGFVGCGFPKSGDNVLSVPTPVNEPEWIRSGEPILFDNQNWYPTDEVENLMDNELYKVGEYRDVPFYLEKTDVKPFDRVYTRFANNRYRAFEKRE
jgi:hypothetical protein